MDLEFLAVYNSATKSKYAPLKGSEFYKDETKKTDVYIKAMSDINFRYRIIFDASGTQYAIGSPNRIFYVEDCFWNNPQEPTEALKIVAEDIRKHLDHPNGLICFYISYKENIPFLYDVMEIPRRTYNYLRGYLESDRAAILNHTFKEEFSRERYIKKLHKAASWRDKGRKGAVYWSENDINTFIGGTEYLRPLSYIKMLKGDQMPKDWESTKKFILNIKMQNLKAGFVSQADALPARTKSFVYSYSKEPTKITKEEWLGLPESEDNNKN